MIYEAIRKYSNYFRNEIEEISALNNRLYKKILFVTLIDSLAKARFPNEKFQKKRFVDMIDIYAEWENVNRISIPQLEITLAGC